jgi:hypothetical protein
VHIIEELQIFSPEQPVQNLLLDGHRVSGQEGALGACFPYRQAVPTGPFLPCPSKWKVIDSRLVAQAI